MWYLDQRKIDLSPIKGISYTVTRRGIVYNAAGADAGHIRLWDTYAQRLRDFEGTVRDTTGHVLFRLKKGDLREESPFSAYRLFSNDLVRSAELVAPRPPYLIEYTYRVEIENSFFWPDWIIEDRFPREKVVYEVTLPHDEGFRWVDVGGVGDPMEERHSKRHAYRWTQHNWSAPPAKNLSSGGAPLLYAVPEEFRMARLRGRTDSWESLGRWYWELTHDKVGLSSPQREAVEAMSMGQENDSAIATRLKDWVSSRWRYVGIAVGIDGWVPHPADRVFASGYGDCKDLSFLWISMLKQMGVVGKPVLVRAGNPYPLNPSFPKNWFDHVAVMLPLGEDTLWADLTDPSYPLGTLPPRLEDRWALVVDSSGATLTKTPVTKADDHQQVWSWSGVLDDNGQLTVKAHGRLTGHWARRLYHFAYGGSNPSTLEIANLLGVNPQQWATESIAIVPGETSGDGGTVQVTATGRIHAWGYAGTHRMICRGTIYGAGDAQDFSREAKTSPIFPHVLIDTLTVLFPAGTGIEALPDTTADVGLGVAEHATFSDGVWRVVHRARVEPGGRDELARANREAILDRFNNLQAREWIFLPGRSIPENSESPVARDSAEGTMSSQLLYRWDSHWINTNRSRTTLPSTDTLVQRLSE